MQCAAAHGRACWLLTAMVIGGGGGGFGSGGGCISGIGQKISFLQHRNRAPTVDFSKH